MKNHFLIVNLIKLVVFNFFKFPCFEYSRITEDFAHRPGVDQQELDECFKISNKKAGHIKYMSVLFVGFSIKFLSYSVISSTQMDYGNPSSSIIDININSSIDVASDNYRGNYNMISCLVTNCSAFRENSTLEKDIHLLPLFIICYPKFSGYVNFLKYCEPLGSMMILSGTSVCIICGILLPATLIIFTHPIHLDMFIYIFMPNLCRSFWQHKIKQQMNVFHESVENFHTNMKLRSEREQLNRDYHHRYRDRSSMTNRLTGPEYPVDTRNEHEMGRGMELGLDCTDNYLPVIRTSWWRPYLLESFSSRLIVFCFYGILTSAIVFGFLLSNILDRSYTHRDYAHYMQSTGCNLWTIRTGDDADHGGSTSYMELMYLDEFEISLNIFDILDDVVGFSPFLPSVGIFIIYWTMTCELDYWSMELRHLLETAVQLMATQNGHQQQQSPGSPTRSIWSPAMGGFLLDFSRERFKLTHRTEWRLVYQSFQPVKPEDQDTYQRLMKSKIESRFHNQQQQANFGDFLRHIYISFRLFEDYARECSQNMMPLIFIVYLLGAGQVLVCLLHSRCMNQFQVFHFCNLVGPILMIILVIILMSNFHAKARQLEPLVWSLLANMDSCRDLELEHLRSLWCKQMTSLNFDGGVHLSLASIRVTYVNIIQVGFRMISLLSESVFNRERKLTLFSIRFAANHLDGDTCISCNEILMTFSSNTLYLLFNSGQIF